MALYGTIYYGGGSFYGAGSLDVPQDVKFYRTDTDGVYVFHWGFKEDFISPVLSTADFDLQLDNVDTFDSPNFTEFTGTTANHFQNGDVRKGFEVPVVARTDKVEKTWYARVRTRIGFNTSDWSEPLLFIIPEKWEQEEAENIVNNLPDLHVYGKEDVLKPVDERNTNLYTVANMYSQEMDTSLYENLLTKTNNYISLCRDSSLDDNFGSMFNYKRPTTQEFVEYRECIRALMLGSLVGGTTDSIERVIRCFVGVSPSLTLIKDFEDFFSSTIREIPPEVPNGAITQFSTSSDYKVGSIQVVHNGNVLNPGIDFVENHATPGFDMTVAPSGGDTLIVFFDIGDPEDPEPITLDIGDSTALTGVTTFTRGSVHVTGAGTAFLTEIRRGHIITDANGFAYGTVLSITDNENLILTNTWTGFTSSVTARRLHFNGTRHITGTLTFTNSDQNVIGVGTAFTDELEIGDEITDNDGSVTGIVLSIIDDENLTLVSNWTGSTGANTNARKLVYEDMTSWSNVSLSHGLVITVHNPGQFVLDQELIETLVTRLVPAHVEVYFQFE